MRGGSTCGGVINEGGEGGLGGGHAKERERESASVSTSERREAERREGGKEEKKKRRRERNESARERDNRNTAVRRDARVIARNLDVPAEHRRLQPKAFAERLRRHSIDPPNGIKGLRRLAPPHSNLNDCSRGREEEGGQRRRAASLARPVRARARLVRTVRSHGSFARAHTRTLSPVQNEALRLHAAVRFFCLLISSSRLRPAGPPLRRARLRDAERGEHSLTMLTVVEQKAGAVVLKDSANVQRVECVEETFRCRRVHRRSGARRAPRNRGPAQRGVALPRVADARALRARAGACARHVRRALVGQAYGISSKMLGGASQIVSMIRVKCNGK